MGEAGGEGDLGQPLAALEGPNSDVGETGWKDGLDQPLALVEGLAGSPREDDLAQPLAGATI